MNIDPWTLALQALNALILVWLLGRFLFRPVVAAISARGASIEASFAEVEAARAAVRSDEDAARAALAQAARSRDAALGDVALEVEASRRDAAEAARTERDALLAEAREEARRLQERAVSDAEHDARLLALDLARRLVARLPADARIAGYPERLGQALAAVPATVRERLGVDGHALRVCVPRALDSGEREAIEGALRAALGREPRFELEIEPELVAGLELRAPHLTVGDNLRADLATLDQALHAEPDGYRDERAG